MGAADGLFLSISFVVMNQSEPDARKLNGMAGLVFIENLTTVKDYQLSRRTQVKLMRGEKEFSLVEPKVKDINDSVKALDYASFTATELLAFLKREGKLIVVVDGKKHELSDTWNQHVLELIKEVENQQEKMGYKK